MSVREDHHGPSGAASKLRLPKVRTRPQPKTADGDSSRRPREEVRPAPPRRGRARLRREPSARRKPRCGTRRAASTRQAVRTLAAQAVRYAKCKSTVFARRRGARARGPPTRTVARARPRLQRRAAAQGDLRGPELRLDEGRDDGGLPRGGPRRRPRPPEERPELLPRPRELRGGRHVRRAAPEARRLRVGPGGPPAQGLHLEVQPAERHEDGTHRRPATAPGQPLRQPPPVLAVRPPPPEHVCGRVPHLHALGLAARGAPREPARGERRRLRRRVPPGPLQHHVARRARRRRLPHRQPQPRRGPVHAVDLRHAERQVLDRDLRRAAVGGRAVPRGGRRGPEPANKRAPSPASSRRRSGRSRATRPPWAATRAPARTFTAMAAVVDTKEGAGPAMPSAATCMATDRGALCVWTQPEDDAVPQDQQVDVVDGNATPMMFVRWLSRGTLRRAPRHAHGRRGPRHRRRVRQRAPRRPRGAPRAPAATARSSSGSSPRRRGPRGFGTAPSSRSASSSSRPRRPPRRAAEPVLGRPGGQAPRGDPGQRPRRRRRAPGRLGTVDAAAADGPTPPRPAPRPSARPAARRSGPTARWASPSSTTATSAASTCSPRTRSSPSWRPSATTGPCGSGTTRTGASRSSSASRTARRPSPSTPNGAWLALGTESGDLLLATCDGNGGAPAARGWAVVQRRRCAARSRPSRPPAPGRGERQARRNGQRPEQADGRPHERGRGPRRRRGQRRGRRREHQARGARRRDGPQVQPRRHEPCRLLHGQVHLRLRGRRRLQAPHGPQGPLVDALHLDFSADGSILQTNDAAHEVLFWDVAQGKQITNAYSLRNTQWATWTCALGWPSRASRRGDRGPLPRDQRRQPLRQGRRHRRAGRQQRPPPRRARACGGCISKDCRLPPRPGLHLTFHADDAKCLSVGGKAATIALWTHSQARTAPRPRPPAAALPIRPTPRAPQPPTRPPRGPPPGRASSRHVTSRGDEQASRGGVRSRVSDDARGGIHECPHGPS